MKVLLGVSGSVAAKLVPNLVRKLCAEGHEVEIVATETSFYFWDRSQTDVKVWTEKDEWPGRKYDPDITIAHIELRDWADVLLIAPITANTLARMANGLAENLLTGITRAWDLEKPVVVAPAMNARMWNHPVTARHLEILRQWYRLTVVDPVCKTLACGEEGIGALADIDDIVKVISSICIK